MDKVDRHVLETELGSSRRAFFQRDSEAKKQAIMQKRRKLVDYNTSMNTLNDSIKKSAIRASAFLKRLRGEKKFSNNTRVTEVLIDD